MLPEFFRRPLATWITAAVGIAAAAYVIVQNPESARKTAVALPSLNVRLDNTSVSGISSGAYMAGQFEFAHAKLVKGAAIIAGGPYGCSESAFAGAIPGGGQLFNLNKAVNGCMLDMLRVWGAADPTTLAEHAVRRAENGEIDPITDVVTDRVYLFTGTADRIVMPAIVRSAEAFYEKVGVPKVNIKFVDTIPAGHAFVTDDQGGACERSSEPFVVDCDYDQAGELLKHIYGDLKPRTLNAGGDYVEFDQRPFGDGSEAGLADTGVVYIPKSCRAGASQCSVHIAFHGCSQNREAVGDMFIKGSGLARWADTNNLVVMFPQVATAAFNPQACWDWWGYTGAGYLTKDAPQIVAVMGMLSALGRRASGSS